jgi:hypothetical protein
MATVSLCHIDGGLKCYQCHTWQHFIRIADPECLSRILIFVYHVPLSRIQQHQQNRNYFIFELDKKFEPIYKEKLYILLKKLSLSSHEYRFPEKPFRIPESKRHRIPDTQHYSFIKIFSLTKKPSTKTINF